MFVNSRRSVLVDKLDGCTTEAPREIARILTCEVATARLQCICGSANLTYCTYYIDLTFIFSTKSLECASELSTFKYWTLSFCGFLYGSVYWAGES